MNFAHSLNYINALCHFDTLVQLASSTFDAHILEILAPLAFGATLVMIHPDGNFDLMYLDKIINEKDITCMFGVPSYLQGLCNCCEKGLGNHWIKMRNICCVGEYNKKTYHYGIIEC